MNVCIYMYVGMYVGRYVRTYVRTCLPIYVCILLLIYRCTVKLYFRIFGQLEWKNPLMAAGRFYASVRFRTLPYQSFIQVVFCLHIGAFGRFCGRHMEAFLNMMHC